jgi:hypothetical protein
MRLILDIIRTPGGRYEGSLTLPETAHREDFAGVLELLEVLERQPWPGEPGGQGATDHEGEAPIP